MQHVIMIQEQYQSTTVWYLCST